MIARDQVCPKCHAHAGQACISKTGRPGKTHTARVDLVKSIVVPAGVSMDRETIEAQIEGRHAAEAQKINEEVDRQVEAHMVNAAQVVREERIQEVLFGIHIARKIGLTQHQLDLRLAEMIVDGDVFDHFTGDDNPMWDDTSALAKKQVERGQ